MQLHFIDHNATQPTLSNAVIVGHFESNVATAKQNRKCLLAGNSGTIMKALSKTLYA